MPWTAARTIQMLRQCPLAIAQQPVYVPGNRCPNCCAEQGHKDNVRSSAVRKQLMQKKSNLQLQLHLPTLDLFWANLSVQRHLRPLDLAWTRKSVQLLRENSAHLPPLDLAWTRTLVWLWVRARTYIIHRSMGQC